MDNESSANNHAAQQLGSWREMRIQHGGTECTGSLGINPFRKTPCPLCLCGEMIFSDAKGRLRRAQTARHIYWRARTFPAARPRELTPAVTSLSYLPVCRFR